MSPKPLNPAIFRKRDITSTQRTESLNGTPFALDMNWEQLSILGRRVRAYSIRSGQDFIKQYDRETFAVILTKGQAEVTSCSSEEKKPLSLGILKAGKMVGELGLVDGSPRSATVTAITACEVLVLTQTDVDQLAIDSPYTAFLLLRRILRDVSGKLRRATGKLTYA